MKRRNFIITSASAGALSLIGGKVLANNSDITVPQPKTIYFHYLLFWLKPELTSTQVKEFQNFFEGLKKLPYVKNVRYGGPANSTPRPVMDNSFTYNASMEFDSLEDLETYGKLDGHLALVAKYKPFFNKMMVHDSVYIQ
ncbi:Dabb family protein [Flavobacterium aquidurense]|uniref:Stress responsive alpha-beta barrel domain-containing protein n=1 Tax=Flavobacterium aquidurense TaxID=362413 RepID=A0A0Q0Y1M0_9FLAO|nr:Dabb family protein [Flavobacterium aquidurense]KQB42623.1 Stress responsive alpha-beta barrel domain-containing protein [Flavobacterium aquidurense]